MKKYTDIYNALLATASQAVNGVVMSISYRAFRPVRG